MRIRGAEYLKWISQGSINIHHDEILSGGAQLSVSVRMKHHGVCGIFIALYAKNGQALYEEAFATLHATPKEGLVWGVAGGVSTFQLNYSQNLSLRVQPPHEA